MSSLLPFKLSSDGELRLWLGETANREPAFETSEQRREQWFANRDWLMQRYGRGGRRPAGWWEFEAAELGLRYPGPDAERSYLYGHSQFSEAEAAAVIADWRKTFERAHRPDFIGHCLGLQGWLNGERGRKALYAWDDIPDSLVKKWTAEKRRGGNPPHAAENPPPDAA
jgi:hypothetical protein